VLMNKSTAHEVDRYLPPDRFTAQVLNPVVGWLTRRGVGVAGSRELRVVGRRSGRVRRTVVNLLELEGASYLVAPRGTTEWVRNVRAAAGAAELVLGRRRTAVRAVELADEAKVPVLRAYLDRWGWEVGSFFEGVDRHATDEQLRAIAPGFPVFEVHPA
jgi:hypothetical protein